MSACATCDGFFFREQHVLVVGGGDTAMEEATYLTKHAKRVTVVHRREDFRASAIMVQRAKDNPKIDWLSNTGIEEIVGEPGKVGVTGARVKNLKTGARRDHHVQRRVRGHRPPAEHRPLQGPARHGRERVSRPAGRPRAAQTATKVPGVFAAGDVADHVYRQAVSAAGTGCMAAIDAQRFLSH